MSATGRMGNGFRRTGRGFGEGRDDENFIDPGAEGAALLGGEAGVVDAALEVPTPEMRM